MIKGDWRSFVHKYITDIYIHTDHNRSLMYGQFWVKVSLTKLGLYNIGYHVLRIIDIHYVTAPSAPTALSDEIHCILQAEKYNTNTRMYYLIEFPFTTAQTPAYVYANYNGWIKRIGLDG